MRTAVLAVLLGIAAATPAAAQIPNIGQLLQGLTTGNRDQDQGLRDAFERGYQRGRQDEARNMRAETDRGNRREDDRRDSRDNGRDERNYGQPSGANTYRR